MKVGDKVKLLSLNQYGGWIAFDQYKIGHVYTIVYSSDDYHQLSTTTREYTLGFYERDLELVQPVVKIDDRFDVQREMLKDNEILRYFESFEAFDATDILNKAVEPILLKDHNFRYDAYMETRDQILEKKFAERRQLAQDVYDELIMEERIKVGL